LWAATDGDGIITVAARAGFFSITASTTFDPTESTEISIQQLKVVVTAAPAKKAAPKKDDKPKLGKGAAEPTAYFESLERNKKGSMKVMKKQWAKAVKKAEAEGKGKKGPYIMRIFKNLMGISTATSEGLPGIGNEPTGVDNSPPPGGPVTNLKHLTNDAVHGTHPFDVAGLTKPKKLDDDAPFDYERWKNSGKPQKPQPNDGDLKVKPRLPLKVPKHLSSADLGHAPAGMPAPKSTKLAKPTDREKVDYLHYPKGDLDKVLTALNNNKEWKLTKDAPGVALYKNKKTKNLITVWKKPEGDGTFQVNVNWD
jgi:hypothetical protein